MAFYAIIRRFKNRKHSVQKKKFWLKLQSYKNKIFFVKVASPGSPGLPHLGDGHSSATHAEWQKSGDRYPYPLSRHRHCRRRPSPPLPSYHYAFHSATLRHAPLRHATLFVNKTMELPKRKGISVARTPCLCQHVNGFFESVPLHSAPSRQEGPGQEVEMGGGGEGGGSGIGEGLGELCSTQAPSHPAQ